jgi:hypothetical protein
MRSGIECARLWIPSTAFVETALKVVVIRLGDTSLPAGSDDLCDATSVDRQCDSGKADPGDPMELEPARRAG